VGDHVVDCRLALKGGAVENLSVCRCMFFGNRVRRGGGFERRWGLLESTW